jgi:antitoxin (DNA-binding transcriptional repressor) of toxin-antitoxin stability system
MTKTISINEIKNSVQTLIELTKNGDEIVIEENGEAIVKITSLVKPERKERILGLGKGDYYMSDDFDDELPDEFWGFDKQL